MWTYNHTDELYHHGVLGMKWGVRRYQNKDGSLTVLGQKRQNQEFSINKRRKNNKRLTDDEVNNPNRWVRDDLERQKKLAENSGYLVKELKNLNNATSYNKSSRTKRKDLSHMTDKELRDKINRELLERQYNDVFYSQNVSKGRQFVNNVLEGSGKALAITGSALGVALAIKELRGF